MKLPLRATLTVATALALWGCHDPVDQAAKARIFSPEDPPRFVTRAADDLGASHLEQSPANLARVLTMGAQEAAERLGPHKVESTLTFHWHLGGHKSELDEKHAVTLGAHGDFRARLDTGDALGPSKQGMEMIRAQGKVYARNRFQKFRERTRDRGAATRYEEQVYDVLGTASALLDGRIAVAPQGPGTVAGRSVQQYAVSLAAAPLPTEAPELPAIAPPKDGFNSQLQHEQALAKGKRPKSVTGTLSVDTETAVVLAAHLVGTVEAPGEGADESTLTFELTQSVTQISSGLTVAAPTDGLLDEGRPPSIAAALARFDLPRNGDARDAGADSEQPGDE